MCLDQQIGRNIEAYIDDVVIKSKTVDNLITDLEETFANLKRYRWKLNLQSASLEFHLVYF